ncbi:MAG: YdiU family protein [Vampirovibrionales bacterium]
MNAPTLNPSPHWQWQHSYMQLPLLLYTPTLPEPVSKPELIVFNHGLALQLGLTSEQWTPEQWAAVLSGNQVLKETTPLAQAYAGHQYGHFTKLGDGRAILLGEHQTPNGSLVDIQLKGSGRTAYSRRGDGRAGLGPMLREYLISEAMAALGIPTTRSLAVVSTGETIERETQLPGAILTRVASSHLRVGTFEYARIFGSTEVLKTLADYAIERHYPACQDHSEPYRSFLAAVIQQQAKLIAQWQSVGFIHGVMNTDNMTISGETIDYGPCAFMEAYHPATVYSFIDRDGRYAYGNQPEIGLWNLTRLAEALLPLLDDAPDTAIEKATETLQGYRGDYQQAFDALMAKKLGLSTVHSGANHALVQEFFQHTQEQALDFTNTCQALTQMAHASMHWHTLPNYWQQPLAFLDQVGWLTRWQTAYQHDHTSKANRRQEMQQTNPIVIPRNHWVEGVLKAAVFENDLSGFHACLNRIQKPFVLQEEDQTDGHYLLPATPEQAIHHTYCGT